MGFLAQLEFKLGSQMMMLLMKITRETTTWTTMMTPSKATKNTKYRKQSKNTFIEIFYGSFVFFGIGAIIHKFGEVG